MKKKKKKLNLHKNRHLFGAHLDIILHYSNWAIKPSRVLKQTNPESSQYNASDFLLSRFSENIGQHWDRIVANHVTTKLRRERHEPYAQNCLVLDLESAFGIQKWKQTKNENKSVQFTEQRIIKLTEIKPGFRVSVASIVYRIFIT